MWSLPLASHYSRLRWDPPRRRHRAWLEDIAVDLCVAGKTAHAVFGDGGAGVSPFLTDNFAPPTSVDWQVRVYGDAAPEVQAVCFENGC